MFYSLYYSTDRRLWKHTVANKIVKGRMVCLSPATLENLAIYLKNYFDIYYKLNNQLSKCD